jgi:hypothetical protein
MPSTCGDVSNLAAQLLLGIAKVDQLRGTRTAGMQHHCSTAACSTQPNPMQAIKQLGTCMVDDSNALPRSSIPLPLLQLSSRSPHAQCQPCYCKLVLVHQATCSELG